jgi:hypothetical protein
MSDLKPFAAASIRFGPTHSFKPSTGGLGTYSLQVFLTGKRRHKHLDLRKGKEREEKERKGKEGNRYRLRGFLETGLTSPSLPQIPYVSQVGLELLIL